MKAHITVFCVLFSFLLSSCAQKRDEVAILTSRLPGGARPSVSQVLAFEAMDPDLNYVAFFAVSPADFDEIVRSGGFKQLASGDESALRYSVGLLRKKHPEIKGLFLDKLYRLPRNNEPYSVYLLLDNAMPGHAIFAKIGF